MLEKRAKAAPSVSGSHFVIVNHEGTISPPIPAKTNAHECVNYHSRITLSPRYDIACVVIVSRQ